MNLISLFSWLISLQADSRSQFSIPPMYQEYQLLPMPVQDVQEYQQPQQPPCYRENEKCIITGSNQDSNMFNMTFFDDTMDEDDCRQMYG